MSDETEKIEQVTKDQREHELLVEKIRAAVAILHMRTELEKPIAPGWSQVAYQAAVDGSIAATARVFLTNLLQK